MYNFQSRKGAHLLAIYLKPTDKPSLGEDSAKTQWRSQSARKRHQFAHSKRVGYDPMRRGFDITNALGAL